MSVKQSFDSSFNSTFYIDSRSSYYSNTNRESDPAPDPKRIQKNKYHGLLYDWWPELASLALSAIAFIATIVTLYPHDLQPLPHWPYSISVNALISVYVLVFKAAILYAVAAAMGQLKWLWYQKQRVLSDLDIYDQASRGPLGSLKILWSIAPRNPLVGAGAIVIILMVIVDPFIQQLLEYYDCRSIVKDARASIGRTEYWQDLDSRSHPIGTATNAGLASWQKAINAGVFASDQTMSFDCVTGNCTFSRPYSTLAFCTLCDDLSDALLIQNLTQTINNKTTWGYNNTLPSSLSLINHEAGESMTWVVSGVKLNNKSGVDIEIILGKTPDNVFTNNFIINTFDNASYETCMSKTGNNIWECRGYGAAMCQLFPCVKKFLATIENGVLNETLIGTDGALEEWSKFAGNGLQDTMTTLDISCATPDDISQLRDAGYVISPDQKWLGFNISWDVSESVPADAPFPQSLQAKGCLFSYDVQSANNLWEDLRHFFVGSLTSTFRAETNLTSLTGPLSLQQIFNWGNTSFERIDSTFSNVSQALTIFSRELGTGNRSVAALGDVNTFHTCLRVRWPWIAFPATLAVFSWIFFAFVLCNQHGANWLPVWKSSTLPLLLNVSINHTNNAGLRLKMTIIGSQIDDLEAIAHQVKAHLEETARGVKLVDVAE
ncbi:hypothetical protein GQX73_g5218 [Xylaria multiplex]|uniref:Uncharacterized protein n=1 Tax=Xylaria multiplex TaxID=323545 RepID=A0A7C8INQ7_9PEZI|nr:hypothetical protein GQX73_g5218 [Xylaria multiplex]